MVDLPLFLVCVCVCGLVEISHRETNGLLLPGKSCYSLGRHLEVEGKKTGHDYNYSNAIAKWISFITCFGRSHRSREKGKQAVELALNDSQTMGNLFRMKVQCQSQKQSKANRFLHVVIARLISHDNHH